MPSENQLAQMAAAKNLSMKNNSCYPNDKIPMPNTSKQPGSMDVTPPSEDKMYGR